MPSSKYTTRARSEELLMKFFINIVLSISLLTTSLYAETAHDLSEKEKIKNELVNYANSISKMSDADFFKTLENIKLTFESKGMTKEANILSNLISDPNARNEVLSNLTERLDQLSENGIAIFFIIGLSQIGDICARNNFGCYLTLVILSVVTLNGDKAEEF